ncbi:flagellar biosynthesis anti-sigma factor FlgM [Pragia fontium]|uniref:Negative regulator of flagellin synthesis n=2 Tax=Pragia fontium TaxID=82985 RepID=A0AAJ4W810_9GAMM|nr:flagellar biosynthesis anti-sigma factor FlgM [Pragia fontium]AKJ41382.1 hypothetical protein QQ39_04240 [Pragia fontium]SFC01788.1 anti-sigma-28 factor, FlgM family [Pragia fontium DSM 5563 = ATCC 49100]SUB81630.1 flagellar biosynthesis anti-sigma factor FlgM [Pragia fontium]VEJ54099.1 flagellar biosynthesis anti-sigma factor FlgM [Pragia fontium]GKX62937.1 hypothetical protein SOASR032_15060 [Pragia fontium]
MKITHTQMNHQHLTTAQNQKAQPTAETAQKRNVASQANEALSETVKVAQKELASMPEVDLQKVAEIKAAIQDGKINIDADELAAAIQKYYRG